MVAIEPKNFPNSAKWEAAKRDLEGKRIYSNDGCDANCEAWLKLMAHCDESLRHEPMSEVVMRVHPRYHHSTAGAAKAWHFGKWHARRPSRGLEFDAVNDITKIDWPSGISGSAQGEADQHFRRLKYIKSFLSIALIRHKDVVGVLNINSSNFYLAGFTDYQKAVLMNLVLPALPNLADMVFLWRKNEYSS